MHNKISPIDQFINFCVWPTDCFVNPNLFPFCSLLPFHQLQPSLLSPSSIPSFTPVFKAITMSSAPQSTTVVIKQEPVSQGGSVPTTNRRSNLPPPTTNLQSQFNQLQENYDYMREKATERWHEIDRLRAELDRARLDLANRKFLILFSPIHARSQLKPAHLAMLNYSQ